MARAQELLSAFLEQQQEANGQDIANTLWAAATLGLDVPQQQARELLLVFLKQVEDASTQAMSNTLWAVAKMRIPILQAEAEQLVQCMTSHQSTNAQDVANALWAVATLQLQLPQQQVQQLLSLLTGQQQTLVPCLMSATRCGQWQRWGYACPISRQMRCCQLWLTRGGVLHHT